ncbi:MAG TPA: hypothetical protein PKO06_01075 [Candidatus Ozemobacteraceae bacterium]|nr:hypothetical protein [Candidatus Ozemobacteraceae bacterium]
MKITNRLNLPSALVNAVRNDPYSAGACDISVTRLVSPPRIVALERQFHDKIEEDVSDRIWTIFGQAVHHILERGEETAVTEERLSIERQAWVISGQFDRLVLAEGLLQDWKVSTVYSAGNGGRFEWEAQLNLLGTILREHGVRVEKLEVVVLMRDWSKTMSLRNPEYPEAAVIKIPVPLWSIERCEEYLDERIRLHQAARTELPLCEAQERWAKPDTWALKKVNRVKAVRVFDNEADAYAACEVAGNEHSVEHRPGQNMRCQNFCSCAAFCSQWQAILKSGGNAGSDDPA